MEAEIILYVKDQERSLLFYTHLFNQNPVLNVPGMVEFEIKQGLKLGLMPYTGIAKILCPAQPHPQTGDGIPRCELYLITKDSKTLLQRALEGGATLVSPPEKRNWGPVVSYVADKDGHILAFAEE